MIPNTTQKSPRSQCTPAPCLQTVRAKPNSRDEFSALALAMAQTGSFKSAQKIHTVLCVWPEETGQWWSEQLAVQLDMYCRATSTNCNGDRDTRRTAGRSLPDAPLNVTWPL